MMEALLLVVCVAILGMVTLGYRKLRLLHLASYELVDKTRAIANESRHTYGQVQAYIDLKDLLDLKQPLPTLRGWAASPDFLLVIARHALARAPAIVLECSSGASTIVLARCMQLTGKGHVYSLEHEARFADITRQNLAYHGLEDWATVIDSPLEPIPNMGDYRWYSLAGLGAITDIEMVVVDGPPWTTNPLARYPAFPMLESRLASNAVVFLDDANRRDEREIVTRWMRDNPDLSSEHLPLEKGGAVLRRKIQAESMGKVV